MAESGQINLRHIPFFKNCRMTRWTAALAKELIEIGERRRGWKWEDQRAVDDEDSAMSN